MLAIVLSAGVIAASTISSPDRWVCRASVLGTHGSSVEVTFKVKADGAVVARSVNWNPPIIANEKAGAGLIKISAQAGISYASPTRDRLGVPTEVWGGVGGWSDAANTPTVKLELSLDRGRAWSSSLGPDSSGPIATHDWIHSPKNPDLLNAIEVAHVAHLSVHGPRGELFGGVRYDLTHRQRNCLVLQAWPLAEAAARDPADHTVECDDAKGVFIGKLVPPPPRSNC